jgi:CxxC motif-containing protein (DUF1111 family)
MKVQRVLTLVGLGALTFAPVAHMQTTTATEAPTGFDNRTNGHISQSQFEEDRDEFEDVESKGTGLGPVFNAKSCAECHGNPVTGGNSQITELRAGRTDENGRFADHPGGSLIHSRALDASIQERILGNRFDIRTFRTSVGTLGDGFVEAMPNARFTEIRDGQPDSMKGTIISVPVIEDGGTLRVGRFGHKNQHASLFSFAGDAYLNEMGITNLVNGRTTFAQENTSNGNSVAAFDDVPDPEDDGDDVRAFARFMRSTKAPPRGPITSSVQAGSALFDQIQCNVCHVRSIQTAPVGFRINGGQLTVDEALGDKIFHPFGDFLLHDVGTGDGIVQNGGEATRTLVRTAPLWGLRTRNRFMHDGESLTYTDAILRHGGQAAAAANAFRALTDDQKSDLFAFLHSL